MGLSVLGCISRHFTVANIRRCDVRYTILWWHSWPPVAEKLGIPVLQDPRALGLWPRLVYLVWRKVTGLYNRVQYFLVYSHRDTRVYRTFQALTFQGVPGKLHALATVHPALRKPVRYILLRYYLDFITPPRLPPLK
jgi:hypothetical protein